ncbi:transcription factor SAC51-like [Asparagus officinalis]|nr:transcription factor SAC51-like [Asparagus officinalis]
MEKDCDHLQLRSFNCATNVGAPALAKQSTNPVVFPTYADPYGFFHLNPALMPPSNPTGFASGQKRFMVFDRSGDRTNLIYTSFGSQFPYPYQTNAGVKQQLPASNETNVSNGDVKEEMHEDTDEIDALLYSDSDNEQEEEEESTGHSPFDATGINFDDREGEVASSAVLQPPPPPAKRRRASSELDSSLADTASSTNCFSNDIECIKKVKREKIHETIGVLRRILPEGKGKGKDAVSVLDEAIRYLKSLRLKAKGLGSSPAI